MSSRSRSILNQIKKLKSANTYIKIIDTGVPCECHGLMFCIKPLTHQERVTIKPKGYF